MAEEPEADDLAGSIERFQLDDPDVRTWFREHLPELRRSASGSRILYRTLAIGFVLGLAAHVGGYLLRGSTSDLLELVVDLLYALGYSLWTGVVVALFVQIIPDVKKRQFNEALAAYEALRSREDRRSRGADPGTRTDPID